MLDVIDCMKTTVEHLQGQVRQGAGIVAASHHGMQFQELLALVLQDLSPPAGLVDEFTCLDPAFSRLQLDGLALGDSIMVYTVQQDRCNVLAIPPIGRESTAGAARVVNGTITVEDDPHLIRLGALHPGLDQPLVRIIVDLAYLSVAVAGSSIHVRGTIGCPFADGAGFDGEHVVSPVVQETSSANQCQCQSKRIQNLIIADIHLTDNENSTQDCGPLCQA